MKFLQNMLLETNRFKQVFFHTFEVLNTTPSRDLEIRILADPSKDLHRYNASSVDEIAIIVPTNQSHSFNPCDIVLHRCGGDLEFIHDHHQAYAPLHYVLLFPYGTPGWTYGLTLQRNAHTASDDDREDDHNNEKHITQVQYYAYCLHV